MRADILIATACAATGFTDFGGDSWREGLDVLVDSLDREAGLNELGHLALDSQITANLTNRLRVTDWLSRHPEVERERIERPTFVLGMPRTGTTLLSYLLDADPEVRSLMRWEATSSIPPPERATFTTDARIDEARAGQAAMSSLNPGFDAIHYEAPDGPTECVTIFSQDFRSLLWETVANVPAYGAWLAECDYRSAYEYHRRELQVLQSRAPGRWVLKSPAHCCGLDALVEQYPDARLVMTHRDPVTVVASVCSLIESLSGTFSDIDHRDYIRDHWSAAIEDLVRRVMEFRDRHGDGTFYDVAYHELVADPVGSVRRIYEHFGDPLSAEAETAMGSYATANQQGVRGVHQYRADDFSLDVDALYQRFGDYMQRYEVSREPSR